MNFKEISMENIAKRLEGLNRKSFRRSEGDAFEGFTYSLFSDKTGKAFNVNIKFVPYGAMTFEMYPGIWALNKAFIPSMSLYCQKINCKIGYVGIDDKGQEAVYHSEAMHIDCAITQDMILAMEKTGMKVLEAHYENLKLCAKGLGIYLKEVEDPSFEEDEFDCNYDEIEESIRDFMISDIECEEVSERIREDGRAEFYALHSEDERAYGVEVSFRHGFLVMKGIYGRCGMTCPEEYKMMSTDYICHINQDCAVGMVRMDENNSIYCEICTPVIHFAKINKKTLTVMKKNMIQIMLDSEKKLQNIVNGICIADEDDDEDDILDASDFLRKMYFARMARNRINHLTEKREDTESSESNENEKNSLYSADENEPSMEEYMDELDDLDILEEESGEDDN